jgi:hypothetical protein
MGMAISMHGRELHTKFLIGKPERKRPVGNLKIYMGDNDKMD